MKNLLVLLFVSILFLAVACAEPDIAPTVTSTPSPMPMPTLFPTTTPVVEAMLDIPVSHGDRQLIIRSVTTSNAVSQDRLFDKNRWSAAQGNQFTLVHGDHRELNNITDGVSGVVFSWFGVLVNNNGMRIEATGQGVGDQFCAECQALTILTGDSHGAISYLFETPITWNQSDISFEYAKLPPVRLTIPEMLPETRIPYLEGIQPPPWHLFAESNHDIDLTFLRKQADGTATLWASDDTGEHSFQLATEEIAYGWAKYSPDGQQALVLTQPEIGWMDLYLYSVNGSYSYPLVLDAEGIEASFSPDGQYIFFSVEPIHGQHTDLYIATKDGSSIQKIELEDELLYFKPSEVGASVAVVTTNQRGSPFILAGGASFDGDEPFQIRYKTLYFLDAENGSNLRMIARRDNLRVFTGGHYWLLVEDSDAGQGKILLWNMKNNDSSVLYENVRGSGCVAPNDSRLLVDAGLFSSENIAQLRSPVVA